VWKITRARGRADGGCAQPPSGGHVVKRQVRGADIGPVPVVDKATGTICAILFALWGVVFAGAAWLGSEIACDEACRDTPRGIGGGPGGHWSEYMSSWQWDAIFWLGVAALAAAVLVVVVAAIGSRRFAIAAFGAHLLGVFAAAWLYDEGPGLWLTGGMFLIFVAGLALGVGTIAGLTRPRTTPIAGAPID
jgi:hypothetical protein